MHFVHLNRFALYEGNEILAKANTIHSFILQLKLESIDTESINL